LTSSFPEGRTNEVVLEEESCETFDHFFRWIYSGQVDIEAQVPFGAVYVLADKFCMEAFKNSIADALIAYCEFYPAPLEQLTPLVSQNLSRSRLVEALMVQIAFELAACEYKLSEESLGYLGNLFGNTEILGRFIEILGKVFLSMGKSDLVYPAGMARCCFHDHRETPECAKKG
jgi:hypothetical protein